MGWLHLTVYNNNSTNIIAYVVTCAFKSWTPQDYRQAKYIGTADIEGYYNIATGWHDRLGS